MCLLKCSRLPVAEPGSSKQVLYRFLGQSGNPQQIISSKRFPLLSLSEF